MASHLCAVAFCCAVIILASCQATLLPPEGHPSSALCGEHLKKETGFLNNLYYVFYESARTSDENHDRHNETQVPVILWLSGGPGCSGIVGSLFEFGPCLFDDEANQLTANPYAWTNIAHVIFVDQPRGTGFTSLFPFLEEHAGSVWTERQATRELAQMVNQFFKKHGELKSNPFFIFGESFGGHYVPDLAAFLLQTAPSTWRHQLKGIGIGNGVVSPIAYVQTYLEFVRTNAYATNLVDVVINELLDVNDAAHRAIHECHNEGLESGKLGTSHHLNFRDRQSDIDDSTSRACRAAETLAGKFFELATSGTMMTGHNIYDLRRRCHMDDELMLCYRFSRLQAFVNQPDVLAYYGVPHGSWELCSSEVITRIRESDRDFESGGTVAFILEQGVRVLVYAGDADSVAPWTMHERWTHDMSWSGQDTFNQADADPFMYNVKEAGTVQTAAGLSLVRVYNAGHMVPHDQPAVALKMVRAFVEHDAHTTMFS